MALSVAVQVRGLAEAHAMIGGIPDATKAASKRMVYRAGSVVMRLWKLYLSGPAGSKRLGVGTGALRNSITMEKVGEYGVVVGTHMIYARIHELGGKTRPHIIRVRNAKALRFFSRSGAVALRASRGDAGGRLQSARLASGKMVLGQLAFARFVNHPGSNIPARPARAPAIEAAGPAMNAIFSYEMDVALAEANRAVGAVTEERNRALLDLENRGLTGRRTGPMKIYKTVRE